MLSLPVLGRGARPCGVSNQCVRSLRLYLSETSRSTSSSDVALHADTKRVVTTSIKDDEPQALRAFDCFQNAIQFNRFVRSSSLVCKLCVDRNHVIGSENFHTVTSKKYDCRIRIHRGIRKPA